MTDMSMDYISQLEDISVGCISKLQEEVQPLREENERPWKIIESERLTEEGFKSYSPQKIKYFTGLPSLATFRPGKVDSQFIVTCYFENSFHYSLFYYHVYKCTQNVKIFDTGMSKSFSPQYLI